ncbi:hypothetical protein FLL45_07950 [Aliikangiella marina]|uniref:Uncharacterized protein n=1 Tax=Aliikangiella marina TaxID=1712262 RepID=A0A545TCE2_9GAMM|nr:M91 family zinc metallopeptidase [Aliikangiella marina]TQV74884.1 hypothetical protein FLL45_07950 [Aliikangiella marina]
MFKHNILLIVAKRNCLLTLLPLVLTFFSLFSSYSLANRAIEPPHNAKKESYFYAPNILIHVDNFGQAIKLFKWLDLIKLTNIGHQTLQSIDSSGHQLVIYHSDSALLSAGVTGAPLSSNLTNGKGESVYIKFYLNMEFAGSNCVMGKSGKYIKFSAIENLFHELVHAKHKMNGTWLYFDSEGQAIREENKFRKEWSIYRSTEVALRSEYGDRGDVKFNRNNRCVTRFSQLENN